MSLSDSENRIFNENNNDERHAETVLFAFGQKHHQMTQSIAWCVWSIVSIVSGLGPDRRKWMGQPEGHLLIPTPLSLSPLLSLFH